MLGLGSTPGLERHIREYRNGRDLNATPRDVLLIDLYGLTAEQVRVRFPAVYQWVLDRVKPEREQNNRAIYRDNWWVFGEPRKDLRPALIDLPRFIATVETSKHRTFQFLDASVLPDNMLIAFGLSDALQLGVLSSQAHVHWSLAAGGRLGVGNDPRYNKTRCFEPFPAADTGLTPALADRIRSLAEQLDAHRKARQAAHDSVTLTGMYNVLGTLRRDEPLSAKDKLVHEQGLVSVLRTLHDEIDAAVLAAYGWSDLQAALADHRPAAAVARAAAVETLLERLVALNAQRAAEEAAGTVRWLRPEFQQRAPAAHADGNTEADTGATAPAQAEMEIDTEQPAPATPAIAPAASASASTAATRRPWPAGLPEQIKAVAEVLASTPGALTLADLEARFTARGRWRDRLPTLLDTLEALGRARRDGAGWRGS